MGQFLTMQLGGIFLFFLSLIAGTLWSVDSEPDPRGACPEHWVDATLTGLGCLLFSSTTSYTWEEANSYCQTEENANLLEIWTSLQSDFIISELILLEDHEDQRAWWTGGTDIGREGEWFWVSSGASVGDFVWSSNMNEPDGSTQLNCLYLNYGQWEYKGSDNPCTSNYYPICQKK